MKTFYAICLAFILVFSIKNTAFAQLGGQSTFAFLKMPQSARVTALGGTLISVRDDDAALGLTNPAMLNRKMHQQMSFNSVFIAPEIASGYAAYAHQVGRWTMQGGIQFLDYGKMKQTDETGTEQGSFGAQETAITVGIGRKINKYYAFGVNARFISSQIESYQSSGLAGDIALAYIDTAHGFTAGLTVRNVGAQLKPYVAGNTEDLPTEIQLGISQRLRHLPFRFSATLQHLQRWEIRYNDPFVVKEANIFGQAQATDTSLDWLDNAARHLVVGGEFLLGKKENLRIRLGYNHLLRSELLPKDGRGFVGLSFGAGLKISKFRVEYGHQIRHFVGGSHHISIMTNLQDFKKKQ
jgi:hypothetical protein